MEQEVDIWDRSRDQSILQVYHVETGEIETLAEFDYLIEAPNWAKDGKFLVYNSEGKIFRFDLKTKESTEIPTGFADNCNNDHVLSPDGVSIAVSHHTKEDGQSRIYTVPINGGIPRLITPLAPSYLHGWSPDGKTLAYCAERDGGYDIYTIPEEGGEEMRLTDTPGLNDGPECDGTGEYIWFNSVRSGLMQVFRMRTDGTEQTQMTFEQDWNLWFPHISPDGKWVVALGYRKGDVKPEEHVPHKNVELKLIPAQGGMVKTIVSLFGGQGTINVNSWSPDSKRFAFVRYQIRSK